MAKKKTLVPNSFQTPNDYIDLYMPFLTDTELRVVLYMTRRILGFHRDERYSRISLEQLIGGLFINEERIDYGVGAGRAAVIKSCKSLESFGLIVKVDNGNKKYSISPLYDLPLENPESIDFDGLIARKEKSSASQMKQTQKATAAKKNGPTSPKSTSNDTNAESTSNDTNSGTLNDTNSGTLNDTFTIYRNQDQKPREETKGITPPVMTVGSTATSAITEVGTGIADGEYLPGMKMPTFQGGKYRQQRLAAENLQKAKALGFTAEDYASLVDYLLDSYGYLGIVDSGSETGDKYLNRAQDTIISLAGVDVKSPEQIDAVFSSFARHDWRSKDGKPSTSLLVEHAAKMKSGDIPTAGNLSQSSSQASSAPPAQEISYNKTAHDWYGGEMKPKQI